MFKKWYAHEITRWNKHPRFYTAVLAFEVIYLAYLVRLNRNWK